ncbi:MAG TPA: ABC transporter ATP-binding protein [Acidimicrobiales bacterium]|nr:ABC transporter ATP-binding protein [Acidimicrobiales bacterium]
MSGIECAGVRVVLDGRAVVDGVSLTVPPGTWTTVVGPNGAGKTTLVHALAGLVESTGEIRLGDRPIRTMNRRERARAVALLPQSPVIPPGMTVADYVSLGRTAHLSAFGSPRPDDRAVVADVVDRLDLTPLARRAVTSLSGGERQRCILARALAQQSPILLLDEPTTGLDLAHAQAVLDLIVEIRRHLGVTVLSTMHDLTLAGSYAERLVLLADGRIAAEGTPAEVLREDVLTRHYGGRMQIVEHEGTLVVVPTPRADATRP